MQNPGGKSALGLDANVAGLLAYLPICFIGLIMSIIIIVTDKTNKLARFHAFQSVLLHVIGVVLYIVGFILSFAAAAAQSTALSLLLMLFWIVFGFGLLAAIVFCMFKAFQGAQFKLPIIGGLADNWSN
jgi:uncharacterized membrane protein